MSIINPYSLEMIKGEEILSRWKL